MDINDRFASKALSVEETPEPFRSAMLGQLLPGEPLRLLVFGPASTNMDVRTPATMLGVTDRRWVLLSDDKGGIHSAECNFTDTLLVEVTSILLYGKLKIDFVANGELQTSMVEFNVVNEELYREVTDLLLSGIEGTPAALTESENEWKKSARQLEGWPLKFYNAMTDYLPTGGPLLAAVHWPAVVGGFRRELAPAAALAVTDRELLLISEEKTASWERARDRHDKLGCIATYFPRVRLATFHIDHQEHFSILELEMHASHGAERLKILMPSEQEQAMAKAMDSISWRNDIRSPSELYESDAE